MLDFAACWHSREMVTSSEHLKELLRDKSLIDRAGRMDLGTIRFLFQMVSSKLLASLGQRKKIN